MESPREDGSREAFERAALGRRRGLLAECWTWLVANKRWWLLPIVLAALLLGLLVVLGGSPLGPWVYSLI